MNIGVAAHITAAAPDGPRFDSSLSTEQRRSPENGIWLCQNCGKLIDNDVTRYTESLVRDWKGRSEAAALAELEGTQERYLELTCDLLVSYAEERITGEHHDYKLEVRLENLGTEALERYQVDLEMPARVIKQPSDIALFVKDRSSRERCFFRVSERNHAREPIYPGDKKLVASVPYYMDDQLLSNRGNLFTEPVRATLYRPSFEPVVVEKPFVEFHVF